jgi:DNA-binding response OmpR family regulator
MSSRVLVVDDNAELRDVLESAFRLARFDVVAVASAEDALDILAQESIPIQFVDIQLPGMDGIEFCRRVRRDQPTACLFAMTAHTSVFDLVTCREAGFDDYFTKPFDLALLVQAAKDAHARIQRWKGQSAG